MARFAQLVGAVSFILMPDLAYPFFNVVPGNILLDYTIIFI